MPCRCQQEARQAAARWAAAKAAAVRTTSTQIRRGGVRGQQLSLSVLRLPFFLLLLQRHLDAQLHPALLEADGALPQAGAAARCRHRDDAEQRASARGCCGGAAAFIAVAAGQGWRRRWRQGDGQRKGCRAATVEAGGRLERAVLHLHSHCEAAGASGGAETAAAGKYDATADSWAGSEAEGGWGRS